MSAHPILIHPYILPASLLQGRGRALLATDSTVTYTFSTTTGGDAATMLSDPSTQHAISSSSSSDSGITVISYGEIYHLTVTSCFYPSLEQAVSSASHSHRKSALIDCTSGAVSSHCRCTDMLLTHTHLLHTVCVIIGCGLQYICVVGVLPRRTNSLCCVQM